MFIVWTSCRVVWVLKELEPENWVNNGGTDFAVQLKAPDVQDVIHKVSSQSRLLSWGCHLLLWRHATHVFERPGRLVHQHSEA